METKIASMENKLREVEEQLSDKPINSNNDWGDDIATDKKLYLTSDDSDTDQETEKLVTKSRRKISKHVAFQENLENHEITRTLSASPVKSKKLSTETVMNKLDEMDERMRNLESRTSATLSSIESVLHSLHSKLE